VHRALLLAMTASPATLVLPFNQVGIGAIA